MNIGDPVTEACSLIGKERKQDFSLVPDNAHKCLRFSGFCPFYIGVSNHDDPIGTSSMVASGLTILPLIKMNKQVLHLRIFLFEPIRPVALEASASGESVSAKAPLASQPSYHD